MTGMKKVVAGIFVLAGLAAAGILAHQAVERDRDYRRLIVQGDEALSRGQTFVAIEAYSGAIALKRGSMLAYLKRGEAHQRRGGAPDTLVAALRDLRTAAELDPSATRTLEELGDVNFQLHRYGNAVASYEAYLRLDDHSRRRLLQAWPGIARGRAAWRARSSALRAGGQNQPDVSRGALRAGSLSEGSSNSLPTRARRSSAPSASRRRSSRHGRSSPSCIEPRTAHGTRSKSSRRSPTLDPARAERLVAVGLAYLRAGSRERAVTALGLRRRAFSGSSGVYAALGPRLARRGGRARRTERRAQSAGGAGACGLRSRRPAAKRWVSTRGRWCSPDGTRRPSRSSARRRGDFPPIQTCCRTTRRSRSVSAISTKRGRRWSRYSVLVDDGRLEAAHAARIGDLSLKLNDAEAAAIVVSEDQTLSTVGTRLFSRGSPMRRRGPARSKRRARRRKRAIKEDPDDPLALAVARRLQAR